LATRGTAGGRCARFCAAKMPAFEKKSSARRVARTLRRLRSYGLKEGSVGINRRTIHARIRFTVNVRPLKKLAKRILPAMLRGWMQRMRQSMKRTHVRYSEDPPYQCVSFGDLRRTTPIHASFSTGRGAYIDRYYIERYLQQQSDCIRGRVLEMANSAYTTRMGGDRVTHSDVLDVRPNHPPATMIADLAAGDGIPSSAFDCIILTQTLNLIYDVRGAIKTVHRILRPGGTVLVSVSGIAQIAPDEMKYCGDYWRFTSLSLCRLFQEEFPADCIEVESHGNVLAALAFLHGLAVEELSHEELNQRDPNFEVSVLLKAVKPLQ
jgi:hypothetical protein